MAPQAFNPPWDYLRVASKPSLQSYELTRLAHAANLRKEIAVLLDEWVNHSACALLARWLLDHRPQLRPLKRIEKAPEPQRHLFAEAASPARAKKTRPPGAAD